MRQRDDALVERLIGRRDPELNVDRVSMADGDPGLKPRKVNLPSAAEWIGANLELAEVIEHLILILAKGGAPALVVSEICVEWAAHALYFAFYNFCRIHSSIRVTPAMQAGISDHVWDIAELIV
jgi:hypothetical protein